MPNWCLTTYAFVGEEKNVSKVYRKLGALFSVDRKADKGSMAGEKNWLGWVVKDVLHRSNKKVPCRGMWYFLTDVNKFKDTDKCVFQLETETAWGPCEELINSLAAKFDLSINYISEEPGCGFYEICNPDGALAPYKYVVFTDNSGSEYFTNWKACSGFLEQNYNFPSNMQGPADADEFISKSKDKLPFISINAFNEVT